MLYTVYITVQYNNYIILTELTFSKPFRSICPLCEHFAVFSCVVCVMCPNYLSFMASAASRDLHACTCTCRHWAPFYINYLPHEISWSSPAWSGIWTVFKIADFWENSSDLPSWLLQHLGQMQLRLLSLRSHNAGPRWTLWQPRSCKLPAHYQTKKTKQTEKKAAFVPSASVAESYVASCWVRIHPAFT